MVTFSPWKNDSIVNCIIQQKNTRTGFVNMSGNNNSVMNSKQFTETMQIFLVADLRCKYIFFIFHCLLPSWWWKCKYDCYLRSYNPSNILHDWSKYVTWLFPSKYLVPNFQNYSSLVAKNIWRIINTPASIWHEHILPYLSLDIICSSKLTVFQEENHSHLGTDNVRRQIANDMFPPSGEYCLYSLLFNNKTMSPSFLRADGWLSLIENKGK